MMSRPSWSIILFAICGFVAFLKWWRLDDHGENIDLYLAIFCAFLVGVVIVRRVREVHATIRKPPKDF